MNESRTAFADARDAFVPTEYLDDLDVAECALDDQLEQLQRQYAAASRAEARATFELDQLEGRADVRPDVVATARRARSSAQRRCARLLRAIDALEDRLEIE